MTGRCYIFDLDGTLADLTHRLHHIKGGKKDWRAFFSHDEVLKDEPIAHVIRLYEVIQCSTAHNNIGENILIVSGRSDECREATEEWLFRNEITHDGLYMRKAGDKRPDNEVKRDILEQIRAEGWVPVMAFDDRDRVVKMWRENGVPCAQVAEGSF
jgi:phosphoglycolate phosphatase-like HAD superfamily hydrolase